MASTDTKHYHSPIPDDIDPTETAEWLESLDYVLEHKGPERVKQLLARSKRPRTATSVELPFTATTPYINTIPRSEQPAYPGNRELERRIKSIVRWNAMAMVTRANRHPSAPGGHISTFASTATLYEVASTTSFAAAARTASAATRSTSRATPRRACTRGPFWKGG